MTTRRQGFIGVVAVATLLVCWAGTALAQPSGPPQAGGLPQCQENLKTCRANLATCPTQLEECEAAEQQFPATGQTTCWNSVGLVIPCAGTGLDGDIQAGATLSYTDNGDGTITDNNTGLVWEKKDKADGIQDPTNLHDVDNRYTWDNAFAVHVAGLNAMNFAGSDKWRVPNVKELQSIMNNENVDPAVSKGLNTFNNNCTPGATVLNGSCTAAFFYWSSTSYANGPDNAWFVDFFDGFVSADSKSNGFHVRAVRGGESRDSRRTLSRDRYRSRWTR
jgi:hypothetical protein